jgi:hypothetical protein
VTIIARDRNSWATRTVVSIRANTSLRWYSWLFTWTWC